jgi:3-mercaptopyruvate sulfurtransferase SseA
MERGYTLVRPLSGGLDAWIEAGYGVEADPLLEAGGGSGLANKT